jgi:aspartate/glutamate/aspartate-prephenate aminotransferase
MLSSTKASRSASVCLAVVLCVHLVHGFVVHKSPCFHVRDTTSGAPLRSTSNDEGVAINPIVASVKVSKTIEVFGLVKQMEAEGETVTSLCVGEPDFPPPKAVLEAAMAAIRGGETRYTAVTGTADLRNAIANDLKRRKGLEYNPQTEIVVGNGVSSAVFRIIADPRVFERA